MITYNDVIKNKFNLSSHQLGTIDFSNKNVIKFKNLLYRPLQKKDNGKDIGSSNYMLNSTYMFLKTKIANPKSFIIDFSNEDCYKNMNFNSFINQNLKENDILLSKDSNIGECCILDQDYPNCMVASAFYKLPLKDYKFYIFAYLKTNHFKNQLNLLVPKGATIRHAGTRFLECTIPFPTGSDYKIIIDYIEFLTKIIIKKESELVKKEQEIFNIIDNELKVNQKTDNIYCLPRIKDFIDGNRIDAGYYGKKLFDVISTIKSYKHGYQTIKNWGYSVSRGQNLQVSCIGKSKTSDKYIEGYYKVAKPTNLSDYGTVINYEYLGNKNELSLLKNGNIVFSAEGTIGKCAMFNNIDNQKIITNIHGIILNKEDHDVEENGFVCSFLRYLRKQKVFDYLSVGGQGGSLAMKYWDDVLIPNFPKSKIKLIATLYCSKLLEKEELININKYNFNIITKQSIQELDKSIKNIKVSINQIFDYIVYNNDFKLNEITTIINNNCK